MTATLNSAQALVEEIGPATSASSPLHIAQALAETIGPATSATAPLHFSQAVVESIGPATSPTAPVRTTQALIETIGSLFAAPATPGFEVGMPGLTFPSMNGLAGWSLHRRPTWSSRIASAASGREVRAPNYATPLYEFELTFEGLASGSGAVGGLFAQSLQTLLGFFLQCQGQNASFLFTDPDFNSVTGGAIGAGDGTTRQFTLQRVVGPYAEAVGWTNAVSAIYVGGTALSGSGWALTQPNSVVLAAAPAAGAAVTADFTYYFPCRFLDDIQDYEEFASQLHALKSCKFRSVRTS